MNRIYSTMGKTALFLCIVLILLVSVYALSISDPRLVVFIPKDADVVYGPADPTITFDVIYDFPGYNVTADVSSIESNGTTVVNLTDSGNSSYSFSYTVGSFVPDGNYTMMVSATNHNTTVVNQSFVLVIDSIPPFIGNESSSPAVVFNYSPVRLNATIFDDN